MEHEQRPRDAIGTVDRRELGISVGAAVEGADEGVGVVRLEPMSDPGERQQIADRGRRDAAGHDRAVVGEEAEDREPSR